MEWGVHKTLILQELNKYGFKYKDIEIEERKRDILAKDELDLRKRIDKVTQDKEQAKKISEKNEIKRNIKKCKTTSLEVDISDIDQNSVHSFEGQKITFIGELVSKPKIITLDHKNLIIVNLTLTNHNDSVKVTMFHNIKLDQTAET